MTREEALQLGATAVPLRKLIKDEYSPATIYRRNKKGKKPMIKVDGTPHRGIASGAIRGLKIPLPEWAEEERKKNNPNFKA